jgi:hypothetical protein
MCAKLFTAQTKFSEVTQRKMSQKVEFHHVSPHRRHGTDVGIRNVSVSNSGTKYLYGEQNKLHTRNLILEFL